MNRLKHTYKYISALAILILSILVAGDGASLAQAAGVEHHAGLVVQFDTGSTQTYCLTFTGDSITGLDLLLKSGLDVRVEQYGGIGGEVCKIGSGGCDYPADLCACQSYGPDGVYWTYSHLSGGAWKSSSVGAAGYKVHDGDVDGWAYSSGKGPSQAPTFAQLCANVEPTDTVQPALSPTPRPTAPQPPRLPSPTPIPTRPLNTVTPTAHVIEIIPTPTRYPRSAATPTNTPLKHTPTATSTHKPLFTATTQPTEQAVAHTATPLRRTATRLPPSVTATGLPSNTPAATPTLVPTNTVLPPTSAATAEVGSTATTPPTQAPIAVTATTAALPPSTPTATPQPPTSSPQSLAQMLALGIVIVVAGGLALWRVFGARGRG